MKQPILGKIDDGKYGHNATAILQQPFDAIDIQSRIFVINAKKVDPFCSFVLWCDARCHRCLCDIFHRMRKCETWQSEGQAHGLQLRILILSVEN